MVTRQTAAIEEPTPEVRLPETAFDQLWLETVARRSWNNSFLTHLFQAHAGAAAIVVDLPSTPEEVTPEKIINTQARIRNIRGILQNAVDSAGQLSDNYKVLVWKTIDALRELRQRPADPTLFTYSAIAEPVMEILTSLAAEYENEITLSTWTHQV